MNQSEGGFSSAEFSVATPPAAEPSGVASKLGRLWHRVLGGGDQPSERGQGQFAQTQWPNTQWEETRSFLSE